MSQPRSALAPAPIVMGVLVLLTGVLAPSSSSTASEPVTVTFATEMLTAPDGRTTIRHLVWDAAAGRYVDLDHSFLAGAALRFVDGRQRAKVKIQKLGVRISSRWEDDVDARRGRVTFRGAADLKNSERNFVDDTIETYVNPNLGHAQTPEMDTTSEKNVAFKGPNQFAGGALEAEDQYTRDDINEIGRDDDNVLFTSEISVPHDPENDAIIRSLRMSSGTCSMQAGRWFCPLFIVEHDIFFRSRQTVDQGTGEGPITIRGFFEDVDETDQFILLISQLKFGHGHNPDAWQHSFQTTGRRAISQGSLDNSNSNTWVETMDGDHGLYDENDPEERRGAPRGRRDAPFLRPFEGAPVEVNELQPPFVSQLQTEEQNLFRFSQFAETNLRGYDKKQKLLVDFFEGDSQAKKDRITRLKGFAVNREIGLSDGSTGDAAYRMSHLYVGKSKDYKKIKDRVMKNGTVNGTVFGIEWDRVLDVTVCVTGRQSDGGPKRKACTMHKYVYNVE